MLSFLHQNSPVCTQIGQNFIPGPGIGLNFNSQDFSWLVQESCVLGKLDITEFYIYINILNSKYSNNIFTLLDCLFVSGITCTQLRKVNLKLFEVLREMIGR